MFSGCVAEVKCDYPDVSAQLKACSDNLSILTAKNDKLEKKLAQAELLMEKPLLKDFENETMLKMLLEKHKATAVKSYDITSWAIDLAIWLNGQGYNAGYSRVMLQDKPGVFCACQINGEIKYLDGEYFVRKAIVGEKYSSLNNVPAPSANDKIIGISTIWNPNYYNE